MMQTVLVVLAILNAVINYKNSLGLQRLVINTNHRLYLYGVYKDFSKQTRNRHLISNDGYRKKKGSFES